MVLGEGNLNVTAGPPLFEKNPNNLEQFKHPLRVHLDSVPFSDASFQIKLCPEPELNSSQPMVDLNVRMHLE